MITREAYDSIPARYRETVHNILDRHFDELKMGIRKDNRESSRTLIKRGIQFVTLPQENYEEIEQVVKEVKDELLDKEFPGEGLIKLRQYIKEYRESLSAGE
jgi:TRAP-type C4-dicarboxylate transport system substrate-binding protein